MSIADTDSSFSSEEKSLFRPFTRESLRAIEQRIAEDHAKQKELEEKRAEGEVSAVEYRPKPVLCVLSIKLLRFIHIFGGVVHCLTLFDVRNITKTIGFKYRLNVELKAGLAYVCAKFRKRSNINTVCFIIF